MEGSPPAGWYADPSGSDRQRYWDGAAWTDHYHPPATHAPAGAGSAPAGTVAPAAQASPLRAPATALAAVGLLLLVSLFLPWLDDGTDSVNAWDIPEDIWGASPAIFSVFWVVVALVAALPLWRAAGADGAGLRGASIAAAVLGALSVALVVLLLVTVNDEFEGVEPQAGLFIGLVASLAIAVAAFMLARRAPKGAAAH